MESDKSYCDQVEWSHQVWDTLCIYMNAHEVYTITRSSLIRWNVDEHVQFFVLHSRHFHMGKICHDRKMSETYRKRGGKIANVVLHASVWSLVGQPRMRIAYFKLIPCSRTTSEKIAFCVLRWNFVPLIPSAIPPRATWNFFKIEFNWTWNQQYEFW